MILIDTKKYDKTNFHKGTKATFTPCRTPNRPADYTSVYKNPYTGKESVSSRYWYTDRGVIRESNHWGLFSAVIWRIKLVFDYKFRDDKAWTDRPQAGFCAWEDFKTW